MTDPTDTTPGDAAGGAPEVPAQAAPPPPDPSTWRAPWVQLKFFTFSPTIYEKMIRRASPGIRAGSLVTVYDKLGRVCGTGFYNKKAHVVLRLPHQGPEPVGEEWFTDMLGRAAALRTDILGLDAVADAYRVVNSDGDRLGGLVVDRYGDTLVADVHSLAVWQRLAGWLKVLHARLGTAREVVRVDPDIARIEGIRGDTPSSGAATAPSKLKIREHGIRYEVDLETGHKTGFFCDQRDNRRRVAAFARGARVLDLCCYTGGFSLAAKVLGGADEVTAVDLDEEAVEQAKRNANLNQVRVNWVHADAFAYARQMQQNGEFYDLVVLDPPKLILGRDDADVFEGRRRYEDLNKLAASLVKPGGFFVTCSCSGLLPADAFEMLVIKAVHRLNRRLQILDRTGPGPDHPVMSNNPEGRYLKVVWGRVE